VGIAVDELTIAELVPHNEAADSNDAPALTGEQWETLAKPVVSPARLLATAPQPVHPPAGDPAPSRCLHRAAAGLP